MNIVLAKAIDGNQDMTYLNRNPAFLVLVFALGCGKSDIYPVGGHIVDMDGNPLPELKGGAIEFEAMDGKTSANSGIDDEGGFRLTTAAPGDGAHVGKNRVAITRRFLGPDTPVPHIILPKYEKFETSGLELMVEPKDNIFTIKVMLRKGGN
jgi:hypothetical protein